jgi:hypothetical protein
MTEHKGLVEALAAAQGDFDSIPKGKHAAAFGGYDYADLSTVLRVVRPVLARHGIAHVQRFDVTEGGQTVLVTELLHGTDTLSSRLPLPIEKLEPQKVGGVVSYYRRYALCAMLSVAPEDEDDDAADTSHVKQPSARPAPVKREAPRGPPDFVQRRPAASAPHEDVGEARYDIEGYQVSAASWIEDARRASMNRQGQALLEWWAKYRQTREMIYRRHEAHRDALAELSAEIKERAGHPAGVPGQPPLDATRAG